MESLSFKSFFFVTVILVELSEFVCGLLFERLLIFPQQIDEHEHSKETDFYPLQRTLLPCVFGPEKTSEVDQACSWHTMGHNETHKKYKDHVMSAFISCDSVNAKFRNRFTIRLHERFIKTIKCNTSNFS